MGRALAISFAAAVLIGVLASLMAKPVRGPLL